MHVSDQLLGVVGRAHNRALRRRAVVLRDLGRGWLRTARATAAVVSFFFGARTESNNLELHVCAGRQSFTELRIPDMQSQLVS